MHHSLTHRAGCCIALWKLLCPLQYFGCRIAWQTTNDCSEPITFSFQPSENVSNCTQSLLYVARSAGGQQSQLTLFTYVAATCTTVSDEEAKQIAYGRDNSNVNSIMSLLKGKGISEERR